MRALKTFGLAALVAMAAMATLGAGTASASKTVICQENQAQCEAVNVKPGGTVITAVNQEQVSLQAKTLLGKETISCQKSEVEGKLKESTNKEQFFLKWQEFGSQPETQWQLEDEITKVTFGECGRVNAEGKKVEPCTAEAIQLPYQTELATNSPQDGNGVLQVFEHATEPPEKGQPGALVKCEALGLNCKFKVKEEGQEGTPKEGVGNFKVEGGNPAKIRAEQIKLKTVTPEKGNCLLIAEGEWSAQYKITKPEQPLWVSHIE